MHTCLVCFYVRQEDIAEEPLNESQPSTADSSTPIDKDIVVGKGYFQEY